MPPLAKAAFAVIILSTNRRPMQIRRSSYAPIQRQAQVTLAKFRSITTVAGII
jgi:hypothetical protein